MPILPANLLLKTAKGETRYMNYESLSDGGFATGSMMGSGGFIILDEDQCIVKNTLTLARFYRHESCGQCSPCREGTGWMEKILQKIESGKGEMSDIDLLWDIQRKNIDHFIDSGNKTIPISIYFVDQLGVVKEISVSV